MRVLEKRHRASPRAAPTNYKQGRTSETPHPTQNPTMLTAMVPARLHGSWTPPGMETPPELLLLALETWRQHTERYRYFAQAGAGDPTGVKLWEHWTGTLHSAPKTKPCSKEPDQLWVDWFNEVKLFSPTVGYLLPEAQRTQMTTQSI